MVIEPHPNINLYEEQKVPRREMLVDGVAFQIRYHCEDVPKFCSICRYFNHWSSRCPDKGKCTLCKDTSHKYRDCPMKDAQQDPVEKVQEISDISMRAQCDGPQLSSTVSQDIDEAMSEQENGNSTDTDSKPEPTEDSRVHASVYDINDSTNSNTSPPEEKGVETYHCKINYDIKSHFPLNTSELALPSLPPCRNCHVMMASLNDELKREFGQAHIICWHNSAKGDVNVFCMDVCSPGRCPDCTQRFSNYT